MESSTVHLDERWYILEDSLGPADYNMAFDEALLIEAGQLERPVLRFYGWNQPAASFGYFQCYQEVARWTWLRPLIRRPTAGGLVPHLADWTYSLVFPPATAWYRLRAVASYQQLHEWLRAAFALLDVATELSPTRRSAENCSLGAPASLPASPDGKPEPDEATGPNRTIQTQCIQTLARSGECFVGAEQHDLLWQGRKVAGAAQRRTRAGLLIQGSVQPPPGLQRSDWQQAMIRSAHDSFRVHWNNLPVDPLLTHLTAKLVAEKYSQPTYNQRR